MKPTSVTWISWRAINGVTLTALYKYIELSKYEGFLYCDLRMVKDTST